VEYNGIKIMITTQTQEQESKISLFEQWTYTLLWSYVHLQLFYIFTPSFLRCLISTEITVQEKVDYLKTQELLTTFFTPLHLQCIWGPYKYIL